MSKPRSSISDYPEHLNPFYEGGRNFSKFGKVKRSSSFGESLRNVLLFKSIRGKKKKVTEDPYNTLPQLRCSIAGTGLSYRQTSPIIYSPVQSSTPLPRSRFSDRVSNPVVYSSNNNIPNEALNPFVENTDVADTNVKHRKKRRAPLPPGSLKADFSSRNTSKWSLTSEGTDISTRSDSEVITDPVAACIANITKEIEKMTENDSMDKFMYPDEEQRHSDIPDVVFSSIDPTPVENLECISHASSTDSNGNLISEPREKTIENAGPDVLYHTETVCNHDCEVTLNDDEKQCTYIKKSNDGLSIVDKLANSITNINLDNSESEENNERLHEADSLTNIINSIEFVEIENLANKISLTHKHNSDDVDEEIKKLGLQKKI